MRTDSNPEGRLFEQFLATAYVAHNYGRSDIGWPSEVSQINATEAMEFHKKYYVGANIVVAVVGDVKASEALPMLEKYFSRVPGGPKPEEMTTVEPKQFAEKTVAIREQTQPILPRGLPPARLSRPGRCGLRRHQRHHVQRPRLAALSQPGARPADCRRGRGLQSLSRRQVSRPVRLLRGSAAGAHAGGDARRHPQGD